MNQPSQPARSVLRPCALALAVALLAGCQSIDMGSAQLRIVDASRDSGALDLYQNGTGLAYNLGFGTLTSYVAMSPGAYTLAADKAGTRQALVEASTHLAAGRQYTAIVGNGLASLQQTILLDQSTPAPTGEIALRFVDQAPHAGAVDVYLVGAGGRLASTAPIATGLSFGAVQGYLNVPAGAYAIEVVPAGTAISTATATLLTGAQVDYLSGAVRTVILLDQDLPATHAPGISAVVADDADAP